MELDGQPQRPRLGEQRRKVFGRKGDGLAEGIDRINQPLGMGGAQRGQGDLCDVTPCVAFVFRGDCMGGQVRGLHYYRAVQPDTAGGAQHLHLVRNGQPVAGLHLDRRRTRGDQLVDPEQGTCQKLILGRRAGGADG